MSGIDDEGAFGRLVTLLRYVDGDYNDDGRFIALKVALGDAARPAYYLATPPSLFKTVIEALGNGALASGARVTVEKPLGRDLALGEGPQPCGAVGVSRRFDLPHRSLSPRGAILNLLQFRFANSSRRRFGTATM